MKPRSKRNRKRPRSNVNGLKEDPIYESFVRQLELDGKPIGGTHKWIKLIKPYPYTYSTFAKARWEGRTIIDVYSAEFGSYPKSYYETAIRQGRILVSDKKVSTSYIVKGGDILTHTVHRHEPGVAVQSSVEPYVNIIGETDELLIVSKPGTMPIHPCGGYNMQSVVNILEKYYKDRSAECTSKVEKLYTIHRLDRLTSGLVILGKTSSVAKHYSKCIMNRLCSKIYLARVAGRFPLKYENLNMLTAKEISESGLPLYGEWKEKVSMTEDVDRVQQRPEKATSHSVDRLRKKHALACWIEDQNGRPFFEEEHLGDTTILEQVFNCRHSVNDWLQSVDAKVDGKEDEVSKLWFHLSCPTRIAKHKDGICEASAFDDLDDDLYMKSVKPAHSSFGVVSYDQATDSTLLICRPYTGRTHQIRLHLQHLQHPIANDPNYGGDIWYGNPEGRRACNIANDRLNAINDNADPSSNSELEKNNKKLKICTEIRRETKTSAIDVPATESEIENGISETVQEKEESIHAFIERTCVWCARCRSVPSADRAILEFVIRSPGIWLHALQYSFAEISVSDDDKKCSANDLVKSFRTNLPEWHNIETS